ncbi:two-component system sensor histidine kinase NtrB [Geoalkalibacter sp.]|uniref:two-component system sensor histidine kinase NtrB n=1 Tax=Geoalkalibacter sp. TaxID=3041440 RepID=UPI00272E80A9|nr:ATP-binding protein [Geoalkalibacter sp.]
MRRSDEIPSGETQACAELRTANQAYARYIRDKTNQLLEMMGTRTLQPEELDDQALIELDPIGIVAGSFKQILAHLNQTIEELRQARAAETEQREFYLREKLKLIQVIESLSEGLLVLDEHNRIVSCNRAADEITDGSATEMLEQPLEALFPDMEPFLRPEARDMQGGEIRHRTRDGRERLLSANIGRLLDREGQCIGRVLTFRDSTDEKKRTELYHRAEKLAAIGQLSAGVAHELNTPLGSVLGYARLLLKDRTLNATQRAWTEIIAEQVKKSSAIIQGLLRFARQSNPAQRCLSACRLNDIITQTLPVLSTELSKRKIELVSDLEPLPAVMADPRELEQLVLNLTMNALQAIGAKGRIEVRTRHVGSRVLMTVEDNGPGIPEQIRSRIFDPFYTTKPLGEGTGLGLSICSGIVSDLGGTIDVASREGQGATFIVSLPAEQV